MTGLVAGCLAVSGCGLPDLKSMNFRVDDRLEFLAPDDRAEVETPFVVSWSMDDFHIAGPGSGPSSQDSGYFAVFVDRQPIRPGETMKAVAKGDPFCLNTPGCPDADYLAQRQIFTTTEKSLDLPQISPLTDRPDDDELHRVVVILMDTSGRRIGESSWTLEVRISGTKP